MIYVAIVLAIAAVCVMAFLMKKRLWIFAIDEGRYDNEIVNRKWYKATTPKGIRVHSYNEVSAEQMRLIDEGVSETFHIADQLYPLGSRDGFDKYIACLFTKHDRCETPGFLNVYKGSQYDQSEYDKDPEVGKVALCAAGRAGIINFTNKGMYLVDDLSVIKNAARYESEHLVLMDLDMDLYAATYNNHSHPILSLPSLESEAVRFQCGEPLK